MSSKQQKDEVEYTDVSHLSVLKESLQMTNPQFQAVTEDVVCYLSGNIVVLLAQSTLEQRHLYGGPGRTVHAVATGAIAKQTDQELSVNKPQQTDESLVFVASTGMLTSGSANYNGLVDVYGFPSRIKLGSFPLPNGVPLSMCCSYDSKKLHVLFRSATCNQLTLAQFSLFTGDMPASTDIMFTEVTCNSLTSVRTPDIAMDPALGLLHTPTSKMVPNHYTTSASVATLVAAQPVLWVANVAMTSSTIALLQGSVSDNSVVVPSTSVNPTFVPFLLKDNSGKAMDNVCDMVWLRHDTLALITTDGSLFTCCIKNLPIPCTSASHILPPSTLATQVAIKGLPRPMFTTHSASSLNRNTFHEEELRILTPIVHPEQPAVVVKLEIVDVDHPVLKQMYQQVEPQYSSEELELLHTIETQCPAALPEKPSRSQLIDGAETVLDTPAISDLLAKREEKCTAEKQQSMDGQFSLHNNAFEVSSRTRTLQDVVQQPTQIARKPAPKRVLSLQVCDKYLLIGAEADTILWYQLSTLSHVFTLVLPATARTAAALLGGSISPPQGQLKPPSLPPLPLRNHGVSRSIINMTFTPTFGSQHVLDASGVTFRVVFSGQPKLLLEGERFVRTAFNYWSKLVGINDNVILNKETETQGAAIVKVLQSLGVSLPKYPLFVPTMPAPAEEEDEDDDLLDATDSKDDELTVLKLKCERFIEDALLNQALCVLLQSLFTVTALGTFALSLDASTAVYRTMHVQTLAVPAFRSKGIHLARPNLTSFQKGDFDAYRAQVAAAEAAASNGNIVVLAAPCGALHLWSIVPRVLVASFSPRYKTTALAALENTVYVGNAYGGIYAIDISTPTAPLLAWSVRVSSTPIQTLALDSLGVCLLVTSDAHTGVYVARTGKVVFHTNTTTIFPKKDSTESKEEQPERLLDVEEHDLETDNAGTLSWPTPRIDSTSHHNVLQSAVYHSINAKVPHITFDRIINTYITSPLPKLTSSVARATGAGRAEPAALRDASSADAFGLGRCAHQVIRERPTQEQLLCSTWLTNMEEGVVAHRLLLTSSHGRVAVFTLPTKAATVVNRAMQPPVYTVLPFAAVAVCAVPTWASALLPAGGVSLTSGLGETGTPSAGCFILFGHADHSVGLYEVIADGKLVHVTSIGPFRSPILAIDFSSHSEPFSSLLLFTVMLGDGTTHLLTLQPNASKDEDVVIGSKSNDTVVFGDPEVYAQTIIRTHSDGMVALPPTTEAQREARILDTTREQSAMQAAVFNIYRKENPDKTFVTSNMGGFTTNDRATNKVQIHSKGFVVTHTPGMSRGKGSVLFSNDARVLITTSWDGHVVCWDISRFLSSQLAQMKVIIGDEAMQDRANISTRAHNTLRGNVVSDFWQERHEREQQSKVVVVEHSEEPGSQHTVDPTVLVLVSNNDHFSKEESSNESFSNSIKDSGVLMDTREATMRQVKIDLAKLRKVVQGVRDKRFRLAHEMSVLNEDKDVDSIMESIMPEEDLCVDKTLIAQVQESCQSLVSEKQKSIRRRGLGARITLERLQNEWVHTCKNKRLICASSNVEDDSHVQNYQVRNGTTKQEKMRKHANYLRNVQISENNWYNELKDLQNTLPKELEYVLLRCPATTPNPLQHAQLSGFLKFDLPEFASNDEAGEDEEEKKQDGDTVTPVSASTKKSVAPSKKREKTKNIVAEGESGEMKKLLADSVSAPTVAQLNLLDDGRVAEETQVDMLELALLYKPSSVGDAASAAAEEDAIVHQDAALRVEVSHAMKAQPSISGNSQDYASPPPKMLADPIATWSQVQKRLQCFLLFAQTVELRDTFNKVLGQLYEFKNAVIDAVNQRNQAIGELCLDIDVEPQLRQLYTGEREELDTKADGAGDGKHLILQSEGFKGALDDMMGGVIRIHQKKVVVVVPAPSWYDPEDTETQLSEAQQAELAEWNVAVEAAKAQQEVTRQESLAEVEEYRHEISALCTALDQAVENVRKTKLHFCKALLQYKTFFLSLHVDYLMCISAQEQQQELKVLLDNYQTYAQQWHVLSNQLQKAVQACQTATQELSLSGPDVDRKTRRELSSFNVPVDQCMRVFRARPKPPVLGFPELYSKDLHSKPIATSVPVDSLIHHLIPADKPNLSALSQFYPKHPIFVNHVVKLFRIVDSEVSLDTKDSAKGKKAPAQKQEAIANIAPVRINPFNICASLRGVGSAVVAFALAGTKETYAWLNPPTVESAPADAVEAAKEAWMCALHLRDVQLKKEVHNQEIEDTCLDLQFSLLKSQTALLNSRIVNNILSQAIERATHKKLVSTTDACVFVVVDTQHVELSMPASLQSDLRHVLPITDVKKLNQQIQGAHDRYESQLKIAYSLRNQARMRWLESNYVGLSIQDTIDITAEIQLLRLTKTLQATIVGGVDMNEKEKTAEKISGQIQMVRDSTGERLLSLKDALDIVKRNFKSVQKENQTLLQAIAVLQANIVQVKNIQNHKNNSLAHTIDTTMFEKPKSVMPSILTVRKLHNVVSAQEDELDELRQQVAQWRNKSFPTFPVALPAPVSIPFLHTHTQTLPKISRGGSRMQPRMQSPPKPATAQNGLRQASRAGTSRLPQDGVVLPPIVRK